MYRLGLTFDSYTRKFHVCAVVIGVQHWSTTYTLRVYVDGYT